MKTLYDLEQSRNAFAKNIQEALNVNVAVEINLHSHLNENNPAYIALLHQANDAEWRVDNAGSCFWIESPPELGDTTLFFDEEQLS